MPELIPSAPVFSAPPEKVPAVPEVSAAKIIEAVLAHVNAEEAKTLEREAAETAERFAQPSLDPLADHLPGAGQRRQRPLNLVRRWFVSRLSN